jgi:hypothetical protein
MLVFVFSRKFSRMFVQKSMRKFSRKQKLMRKLSQKQKFSQKLRKWSSMVKYNIDQDSSQFFVITFVRMKNFRGNLQKKQKFCESFCKNKYFRKTKFREILQKFAYFRWCFAFHENEKIVFRFNPRWRY